MSRRTACFILLFLMLSGAKSFARDTRQNVLVLSSYHQGLSWTDSIVDGIRSVFNQADRDAELWFEYMDTKRIFHDNSFELLYELYKERFQAQRFDLILAADNNAFDFLRQYRDRLFPETPVVFCGVNFFDESSLAGHTQFTGVAEISDFIGSFELALALHPETQRFIIFNDRTVTGQAIQDHLDQAIASFADRVDIVLHRDLAMNEILQTVSQVQANTLFFVGLLNRDAAGHYFSYERSMKLISKNAQVPVYGFWDFYLGYGVLGGNMTSGSSQGEAAATIALRILAGEDADTIPVVQQGVHQYMFDYEQLTRFGLPVSELPPKSVIINKPISFYEQHRFWIFGVAGLAGIIVILATIVQVRTADLYHANMRLHQDIDARQKIEDTLRTTRDALTRRVDELATLNRITQTIATTHDLHSMMQMIAKEMVLLFHARNSGIALLNDSQTALTVVADYTKNQHEPSAVGIVLPLKNYPATHLVIEQKQGAIISQAQSNPLTEGIHDILRTRRTEGLMIVPLLARGEVIGTIGIDSTDKNREFSPEELKLAETIAGQIAGGIENARLFEEEHRRHQIAESLREVSTALMSSLELDTVLQKIMKQLKKVISYDSGAIFLKEGDELILSNGMNLHQDAIGYRFPLASPNPTVRVLQQQQARILSDTAAEPSWYAWKDNRIKSWMGAPLLTSKREAIGVLTADSFSVGTYRESDSKLLQLFANQAAIAIENARQVQQTKEALDETRLLYKVSRILADSHDIQKGVERVLGEYLQALGVKQGGVSLFDTEKQCGRLYALFQDGQPHTPELEIPNISQAHQQIIAQGRPLAITDVLNDPLLKENRDIAEALHVKSILLAPLLVRGQVIGLLGADSTRRIRHFSEREIALAQSIADQVAAAVDRARLLEEAYHAKEEAEEANQAKNIFFANMSHELRTPLNAILGLTGIMVHEGRLPGEEQENLHIIQRSGEHLLQLINNVIDLSRIEAGHMPLKEQGVDLYQLLDDLQNMLSLKAREKLLRLSFHRAADVPRDIRVDAVRLRQVLINLLNNAIKFTERGIVALDVESVAHEQDASSIRLIFGVTDTGPGIAPEEIDHVFEAFVQTASGRQTREGSGLGLSISRKFVQLMGGDIRVESSIGQGTTFSFDIHVHQMTGLDITAPQAMRRAVALEPGQPQHRLLVVDDKADNRAVLCKLLRPFGFDLQEAQNGAQAVELWERRQPQLIWMDIRMPSMDGYETARHIRSSAHGAQPVIIAVTADVLDENRSDEDSHLFDDVLHKPFHDTEVFRLLETHLGLRFLYEKKHEITTPENSASASAEGRQEHVTAEMLARLPDTEYQQLRQASEALHIEAVQELIGQIRERDAAIADALDTLAGQYRFDILQRLFKEREHDPI